MAGTTGGLAAGRLGSAGRWTAFGMPPATGKGWAMAPDLRSGRQGRQASQNSSSPPSSKLSDKVS